MNELLDWLAYIGLTVAVIAIGALTAYYVKWKREKGIDDAGFGEMLLGRLRDVVAKMRDKAGSKLGVIIILLLPLLSACGAVQAASDVYRSLSNDTAVTVHRHEFDTVVVKHVYPCDSVEVEPVPGY